jgi:hypothetical protein
MSDQLTTAQVRQYHSNIEMLLQQKGGVLGSLVRNEQQKAEKDFWEQLGSVRASKVDTRFAPSPQANTPHDRRMVTLAPYHTGDFIDSFEKALTLIDPSSAYVQNFVNALLREKDAVVYLAIFGTSYTGKEGTTTVAWDSTYRTVVDESFGTANSGLIVKKLIEAKRAWLANHNNPQDESPQIVINAAGSADLLNETQVTSADYNSVRALVSGEVNTFMGFGFHHWEGYIPEDSSTNIMRGSSVGAGTETIDRYPVFTKSSVLLATGMGIETEVCRRQDRSFHWYGYAKAMYGATRMQEKKIVEIEAKR